MYFDKSVSLKVARDLHHSILCLNAMEVSTVEENIYQIVLFFLEKIGLKHIKAKTKWPLLADDTFKCIFLN